MLKPVALRAVREQRGLALNLVANYATISEARLRQFEEGDSSPSLQQVEKLALIYGVPVYALFSADIPNLPEIITDFRKQDPSPASLSPGGARTLWAVEKAAVFTRQLALELDEVLPPIDRQVAADTAKAGENLRSEFDEWWRRKAKGLALVGSKEQTFTMAFRLFVESKGCVLSINDAPPGDYLGFFLSPDERCPAIFVNRKVSSKKAQLFTLAHEYCHALINEEGISSPFVVRNKIERACNVFAANFVAPIKDFKRTVDKQGRSDRSEAVSLINAVSAETLLSKHAAAIRLVESGYLTQLQLRRWEKIFRKKPRAEKEEEETGPGFAPPHAKRISELGYYSVYLASRSVGRKIIDSLDVQAGLGLSERLQQRAFALAERRMDVARS